MRIHSLRPSLIGAIFSIVLVTACGDSDKVTRSALDSEQDLLRFVPADTPYLIATPGDMPDDLLDKLEPQVDVMLKAYHSIIRAMIENAYSKAREADSDLASYQKIMPVVEELETLMSVDGLRQAGVARNSDIAIYGVGLLPVFRLSLSDGASLEAVITRLEEKANQKMNVASIDGTSYRYAGDDEGRIVVAIVDQDLVVSIMPTALSDDMFKQVLGLTLPANNIASSGALREVAVAYGLSDAMIGMVDFTRIADIFLNSASGINSELLSLMEYDGSSLTDVCKSEILTMVGVMPRVVFGYSELTSRVMTSKIVMELRDDLATGIATLTGVVPGLGQPQGGLFSIGMSTDLLAARSFYSARLDAIEAEPFECELFADVQDSVVAGRDVLNQPIPPVVYGFNGFLASVSKIDGMDLTRNVPPTSVDMRLLVAVDNAASLIAMGAMFSPELATMDIQSGGDPVRLAMPMLESIGIDAFVAMTDDAVAVSVGDGMQDGLGGMLKAATSKPSPFLVVDMDAERYYGFVSDAISVQAGTLASMPELLEATQAMSQSIQTLIDRVGLVVNFTENGVEIESRIQLSE
ncbi:MAG: hypothetical protein O3A13_08000 [Proteobacteria bacterium]|nr:hypothetical protein [Pseudomonadota bacterium]MDA0993563.1 hypothetical protein [Pseudomonadota bacterium]